MVSYIEGYAQILRMIRKKRGLKYEKHGLQGMLKAVLLSIVKSGPFKKCYQCGLEDLLKAPPLNNVKGPLRNCLLKAIKRYI